MDDYKVGDTVEAMPNMFTKTGAVGVVRGVGHTFLDVEFRRGDVWPEVDNSLLMAPREIRKVVPDAV